MRLYFAYGSNLNWPQMQARCPDASFVCQAVLRDHTLAFTRDSPPRGCGVADALFARSSDLFGVLYRVSDADIATLDRLEGHLPGVDAYRRVEKRVERLDGDKDPATVVAETYVVANPIPHVPPSRAYLALIVSGARSRALPSAYVERISQIRCVEDLHGDM
jgi:hypothetical protein